MSEGVPSITYGDTVIAYGDVNTIQMVTLQEEGILNNRFGSFKHSAFIGKTFGERVEDSKGKGYIFAMRLTPQLFTEALSRSTQVLYAADIALILFKLGLGPGDTVFEAGTGSSSLTYALADAVGAGGAVYTFEYNKERFEASRQLFAALRINQVLNFHQNVLKEGFKCGSAGGCPAKAVFLDLPKPEQAVPHAAHVLGRGGRLCAFSPCIEQVQATARALAAAGFLDVETVEVLERSIQSRYADKAAERRNVFVHGAEGAKTHTGFLTFATKFIGL